MNEENDLIRLIQIIERLEITARERDNELCHAREIIQRLQRRDAAHGSRDSAANTPPHLSLATVTSARNTTVRGTAIVGPPRKTVSAAREGNGVTTHDLVTGFDFQVGDWVCINNPREGQPHIGKIIGATRDHLIKVEGVIKTDGKDVIVTVRRAPKNITLANSSSL